MAVDDDRWIPPTLPEDPRELRKIRNRLVILALLGALAMLISKIAAR